MGLLSELSRGSYGTDWPVPLVGNVWWTNSLLGSVKFDCWSFFEGC
jgi:hypothetical protein